MSNRVAICAEGNQVSRWIDNLVLVKFGNGLHVVYMDKAFCMRAVRFLKVKVTGFTSKPMNSDCLKPKLRTALIPHTVIGDFFPFSPDNSSLKFLCTID
ncbi:hypothetical protein PS850_03726 [Pseudomonas fluorescens]|nr:hypothetical protein PS850_03726 [Pseudomonas fluorescens]